MNNFKFEKLETINALDDLMCFVTGFSFSFGIAIALT